jgi:hypothetical protein
MDNWIIKIGNPKPKMVSGKNSKIRKCKHHVRKIYKISKQNLLENIQ